MFSQPLHGKTPAETKNVMVLGDKLDKRMITLGQDQPLFLFISIQDQLYAQTLDYELTQSP